MENEILGLWRDHLKDIMLVATFFGGLFVGVKKLYDMAVKLDDILHQGETAATHAEKIRQELLEHVREEDALNRSRDETLNALSSNVKEITREIRPNGGSSMKDVLNHTAEVVQSNAVRISVIEEWKGTVGPLLVESMNNRPRPRPKRKR